MSNDRTTETTETTKLAEAQAVGFAALRSRGGRLTSPAKCPYRRADRVAAFDRGYEDARERWTVGQVQLEEHHAS